MLTPTPTPAKKKTIRSRHDRSDPDPNYQIKCPCPSPVPEKGIPEEKAIPAPEKAIPAAEKAIRPRPRSPQTARRRGGDDPNGKGASLTASDVLWSDPDAQPGLRFNAGRGIGLAFGPDATDAFLAANGLRLMIRSHEAREPAGNELGMRGNERCPRAATSIRGLK